MISPASRSTAAAAASAAACGECGDHHRVGLGAGALDDDAGAGDDPAGALVLAQPQRGNVLASSGVMAPASAFQWKVPLAVLQCPSP